MTYTMGIDIGSSACKAVILKDGDEIVGTFKVAVGTGTTGPNRAFEGVLESAGLSADEIDYVLATGYGRNTFERADAQMSELSCHAKGANHLFPDVRTVIDIGGQDVKVIQIDHGAMVNFQMNDKCAAGTGRFLEVMANTLSLRPNEMFELARLDSDTTISSMCTVFAESEVIGLIGKGEPKENIAYAVVDSTIRKVTAQLSRMNGEMSTFCLTGGLCECEYIREALSKKLGKEVISSPDARYAGAIGAALSAMKIR